MRRSTPRRTRGGAPHSRAPRRNRCARTHAPERPEIGAMTAASEAAVPAAAAAEPLAARRGSQRAPFRPRRPTRPTTTARRRTHARGATPGRAPPSGDPGRGGRGPARATPAVVRSRGRDDAPGVRARRGSDRPRGGASGRAAAPRGRGGPPGAAPRATTRRLPGDERRLRVGSRPPILSRKTPTPAPRSACCTSTP